MDRVIVAAFIAVGTFVGIALIRVALGMFCGWLFVKCMGVSTVAGLDMIDLCGWAAFALPLMMGTALNVNAKDD